MIVFMRRHARAPRGDLRTSAAGALAPARRGAWWRWPSSPSSARASRPRCSCSPPSRPRSASARRGRPRRRLRRARRPRDRLGDLQRRHASESPALLQDHLGPARDHRRRSAPARSTRQRGRLSPTGHAQVAGPLRLVVPARTRHDRPHHRPARHLPLPVVAEVVAWLLYAVPMLAFVLWPHRAGGASHPAARPDPRRPEHS